MNTETSGDAPVATGELSVDEAGERIAQLLAQRGDSEGSETTEDDDPPADDENAALEGDEESEDGSEKQGEPEKPQEQPKFRVKVDDAEVEVTLEELQKGYSREADYTRKTMALSQEKTALSAERERTVNLLSQLEQALQQPQHSPQELDQLRLDDPAEYAARIADQFQLTQHLQAVTAEKQRLEAAKQADEAKVFADRLKAEGDKLISARPDWKDPEKAKASMAAISTYAASLGATSEDIASITDHRLIIALEDAARYRALMAKTPETRAKIDAVKTAKAGSPVAASKSDDYARARNRLAQTHSVDDAAQAIDRLFSRAQRK